MLIEFGRFQSKYQCQQNEEQECMGGYGIPFYPSWGKVPKKVLFQNVPNKNVILKGSQRIFIVLKGLGFVMSDL